MLQCHVKRRGAFFRPALPERGDGFMKKQTKKPASSSAATAKALLARREKRKILFRRAAILFLLFTVFEALYQVLLWIERAAASPVPYGLLSYLAAALCLFLIYLFLNRGLSRAPVTEEMLSGALTRDQRSRMADQINRDKKRARTLLYFLLPIVLVLLLDFLDLFVLTPLLLAARV